MAIRIKDISVPISSQLPVWPGDPPIEIIHESEIEKGDMANISRINFGVHTGTHIDAPFHFLKNGIKVEAIQLDQLVGEVQVVEINEKISLIQAEDLYNLKLNHWSERVLIKTMNSHFWRKKDHIFHKDYCALSESAAHFLVEEGVKLVGIDYLSIAPFDEPENVHKILLSNGIIILESINLDGIAPGLYKLVCLPLRILDVEGAPARAVLIVDD